MQPDVKAHANVAEERIAECRCNDDEEPCKEDVGFTPCPHIGHEHRHPEKKQCRAKVTRDDEHEHGEPPECDERCDEAHGRQMKKEETACGESQHSEMVGKIRCKEENEQNLAKLRWLHRKGTERDPVLIAADTHAENQRKH